MGTALRGLLVVGVLLIGAAHAANTPCSGSKGGVSHCAGGRFVCNDDSLSASRRICVGAGNGVPGATSFRPVADGGQCPCSSGRHCTGPRGGRYCLAPNGSKHYLPRD